MLIGTGQSYKGSLLGLHKEDNIWLETGTALSQDINNYSPYEIRWRKTIKRKLKAPVNFAPLLRQWLTY